MSAIYGIIDKKNGSVDTGLGIKLRDTIIHRATDGSGEQVHEATLFGHCRLNVYPHQEKEHLPLETDEFLFTANARLHNRDMLIDKMGNNDQFQHYPDTHLVFEAYRKWGRSCMDHMDGEFVFAAWDKQARELFIASDHIGFKPLFYHDSPEQFIFCSEIKGVEAVKTAPDVFDEESLVELFYKKGDPERTYNRSIKALCGGNFLVLKQNKLSKTRYWNFKPTGRYRFTKDQDWYDCMREVLERAVAIRLIGDVPVGLTLSGGLDSGSVAGILSRLLKKQNKPLYTFSSVLPESYTGKEKDEKEYINALLNKYDNIIPSYVAAEGGSPFKDVERGFLSDDTLPNYFHYMDHALCRAASAQGVKIFYSGFGGDFWASSKGLKVIFYMVKRFELTKALHYLKDLARTENTSLYSQLKREIFLHNNIVKHFVKRNAWNQEKIFNPVFSKKLRLWEGKDIGSNMLRYINKGKVSRLAGIFDNRNESYCMATATPFFDKGLFEFLADMPEEYFLKGGYRRSHIRYAMTAILPPEIQWRKTKGSYVVDYLERYNLERPEIMNQLAELRSNPLLSSYFNTIRCRELIEDLKNNATPFVKTMSLRVQLIIISITIMIYLEKKGYKFY